MHVHSVLGLMMALMTLSRSAVAAEGWTPEPPAAPLLAPERHGSASDAPGTAERGGAVPARTRHATVDLTTASAAELMRLPGIGPARARAILDYRAVRPFLRVADLRRVRGIGPRLFATLRPLVHVSGGAQTSERRPGGGS